MSKQSSRERAAAAAALKGPNTCTDAKGEMPWQSLIAHMSYSNGRLDKIILDRLRLFLYVGYCIFT